nr:MAG TPA: hypothetical protein [Caudoviricetes sp.]
MHANIFHMAYISSTTIVIADMGRNEDIYY